MSSSTASSAEAPIKSSDATSSSTNSNDTVVKERTARVESEAVVEVNANEIELRFVFANRDGKFVTIVISLDKTVEDMKECLKAKWPAEVGECPSLDRIRMICMGRGILSPDDSKLSSFNLPKFSTHSTPINCSIRPLNATPSVGKGRTPVAKASPPTRTAGVNAPANDNGDARVDSRCACNIL
ncbi:hypothetical protein TrRE_jg11062 [Triparma retinervis]|uniref:UBL3-like ubiquitin domain-containing protein n=1 Tax=Triparma retinervis TaxID=2557542 RepID=A0A9W6Z4P9_9STRA|nr:hypothetical protein TrRE_jg11062 [Triparma retinervis]